ncbi:unnamed protein product, partial [Lymnaea stagnalis]
MIYPEKERPNASEVKRGRGRPPLLNKQLPSQQNPDRSPSLRRPGRPPRTVSHPPSSTDFGGGNIEAEAEIEESNSSCPRNENENHLEEAPVESKSEDRPITNEIDKNGNQGRYTSGSFKNSCTHQEAQSAGESSMENNSGPLVDISKPNELNGDKSSPQTQDYIDLTNEGDEVGETFHPDQSKLSDGERKSESQSESSITNTMPANSENNGEGSGATSSAAGTGTGDITVKDDDAGDAPPQLRTLNDALKTTGQKLRIIIRSPNVVAAQKIGELIKKTAMGVNSKQSEITVTTTDSS